MTRRRPLRSTRRLLALALPAAGALAPAGAGLADPATGAILNRYGLPGAIDTPSAEMLPDGTLAAMLSYSALGNSVGVGFQILPRVSTVLRYGQFDSTEEDRGYVRDRSFDIRRPTSPTRPPGWAGARPGRWASRTPSAPGFTPPNTSSRPGP